MDFRNEVRNRLNEKVNDLSYDEVISIEKSIFNWTIEYAENNNIVKTWLEKKFSNVYINKANHILTHLNVFLFSYK